MKIPVRISINGRIYEDEVEPRLLLVPFIRDTAGLTGTKVGCDTSQCGACTVMMNGVSVKACNSLAVQADGATITTIEGLGEDGKLHALQEAFWNKHGLQCGFCTPGMIMAANELLRVNPDPSEEEVRNALTGNYCRCTGYQNIVLAVGEAAAVMGGKS